ncbi:MAG: hypothetical protein PVJ67_01435 [Candidatus Pacearchaeota archaeon]|jgi:hypothetical protein
MTFDLIVPELSAKPKTTKDAVITLLSFEWPLSLRQIYFRIKKQYGYSATYQSVYKAVNELYSKNVLKKFDKKYEINISWVKKLQSFTDIVETNYYAKEKVKTLSGVHKSNKGEDFIVLTFETIFDAEKYLYYFIKNELIKTKDDVVCYKTANEWKPIFYLRAEYNYFKKLGKRNHKFYFINCGSSWIEEQLAKFYSLIGVNHKTVKQTVSNDSIVFGDYFIQIFIPENLKEKMKKYLKKKDVFNLLREVLEEKSIIRVTMNKDKNLAEEMRKHFLKEFRNK